MHLTYLGHAGFLAETESSLVLMDPWLSPEGAFDSCWFQYPRNHHLAEPLQKAFNSTSKERYIYLSHEHNDHLDPVFLKTLNTAQATFIIPRFRRTALRDKLANLPAARTVLCDNGQTVPIPGGRLTLFVDDREMNRDSALLLQADGHSFLNLNDCKIHESLPAIVQREGPIDLYTCQFSGASWHPACYDYSDRLYQAICEEKSVGKFEAVARSILAVTPRAFLPSGGPPVFLDPELQHFNFEPGPFPRARELVKFLEERLKGSGIACAEIGPGDVIDPGTGQARVTDGWIDDREFEKYVRAYAADYTEFFQERAQTAKEIDASSLLDPLQAELEGRLQHLTLRARITIPLYVGIREVPSPLLRVDFRSGTIKFASGIEEDAFYSITIPVQLVAKVLDRRMTWQELSLTFKPRLKRVPDTYQTVVHGFLVMEDPEDIRWFCTKLLEIEGQKERIVVQTGGRRFCVDRYCPHQGGDLTQGWVEADRYLVCGRHRLRYDLEDGGQCTTTNLTIHATLETPASTPRPSTNPAR